MSDDGRLPPWAGEVDGGVEVQHPSAATVDRLVLFVVGPLALTFLVGVGWLLISEVTMGRLVAALVVVLLAGLPIVLLVGVRRTQPRSWRMDPDGVTTRRSNGASQISWRVVDRIVIVDEVRSIGRGGRRIQAIQVMAASSEIALVAAPRDVAPSEAVDALRAVLAFCGGRGWIPRTVEVQDIPAA